MKEIAIAYLTAFATKNLDRLSELYSDDVVLWEWGENIYVGKEDVLKANKEVFDSTQEIRMVLQGEAWVDLYNKGYFELTLLLDTGILSVVDVITVKDGKIISVQAYRGF